MGKLGPCINCGDKADHMHHVVPKVLGGEEGSNLVPLCGSCHDKVHDTSHLKLKALQRAGIEKAKKEGKYKGRQATINRLEICYWNSQGLSQYKIAKQMKISRMTVHRVLNEEGLKKVRVKMKGTSSGQTI